MYQEAPGKKWGYILDYVWVRRNVPQKAPRKKYPRDISTEENIERMLLSKLFVVVAADVFDCSRRSTSKTGILGQNTTKKNNGTQQWIAFLAIMSALLSSL